MKERYLLKFVAVIAGLLSLSSHAAAIGKAPDLGPVTMLIVDNPPDFIEVRLDQVKAQKDRCSWSAPASLFVVDCILADESAGAFSTSSPSFGEIDLHSYRYYSKPRRLGPGIWEEHHHYGVWTREVNGQVLRSDAEVVIWFDRAEPAKLHGWIALKDLRVTYTLAGRRD